MTSIWAVRRSATDSKVSGLCGGIAQHWGVDPVLVRVGAVLLALSGGIGVVLYVAGWLMIPLDGKSQGHLDDVLPQTRRWPRELKLVLVVVACIIGASVLSPVLPFGFGSALVLAAIWYFGYYKNRAQRRSPGTPSDTSAGTSFGAGSADPGTNAPGATGAVGPTGAAGSPQQPQYQYFTFDGPDTPFTEAAKVWQQRMRQHQRAEAGFAGQPTGPYATSQLYPTGPQVAEQAFLATPDPAGLYTPAEPSTTSGTLTRPPNRGLARPARRLRLVAILVLGLAMSGLGVASALGVAIAPATYLAVALLIAGLTLIAGAWIGRARGVLPVALLLAVATIVYGAGDTRLAQDHVGTHQVAYANSAVMPATENWRTGRMTVDLTGLQVAGNRDFSTHLDQGQLTLVVPANTRVRVESRVDVGQLKLTGREDQWGTALSMTTPYTGPEPGGPVLTVRASVGQGILEVKS